MNVVLKDLGLSTIKWQTARRGEVAYKPNGSVMKGILLNSRSPMDVTDAGTRRKNNKIAEVCEAFRERGFTVVFEYDVLTCTLGKIEYKFLVTDYPTYHWDVDYDRGYRTEYLELFGAAKKAVKVKVEDVLTEGDDWEGDEEDAPPCNLGMRKVTHVPVDGEEDFDF